MPATFNRPSGMKYTEMCMYIDEQMWKIKNSGDYPDVETRIYEYLYHILYALARKGAFFRDFSDYDDFAIYGATEVYNALRKKLLNEGKEIHGKIIVPVKNTLDFIKSVLLPLKVDFQKDAYSTIYNPDVKSQGTEIIDADLKQAIRSQYSNDLEDDLKEVLAVLPDKITTLLNKTPFRNDKLFIKKLKISCLLTLINNITLPNKVLKRTHKSNVKIDPNIGPESVILWHMEEKYRDYVWFQVVKIKHLFSKELYDQRSYLELSDETVDNIIKSAYATYDTTDGDF